MAALGKQLLGCGEGLRLARSRSSLDDQKLGTPSERGDGRSLRDIQALGPSVGPGVGLGVAVRVGERGNMGGLLGAADEPGDEVGLDGQHLA